jgi:hypothetical protein
LCRFRPDCEHDDLPGFPGFTDVEIECIRQAVHSFTVDPWATLDETENEAVFDSPFDSDDEEWDGDDPFPVPSPTIINHSWKEEIILMK